MAETQPVPKFVRRYTASPGDAITCGKISVQNDGVGAGSRKPFSVPCTRRLVSVLPVNVANRCYPVGPD